MVDFQKALKNPGSVFDSPEQVLSDPRLDREGKRAILRSWERSVRGLAAAGANSAYDESTVLGQVHAALAALADP